jgi:hypothetical protein
LLKYDILTLRPQLIIDHDYVFDAESAEAAQYSVIDADYTAEEQGVSLAPVYARMLRPDEVRYDPTNPQDWTHLYRVVAVERKNGTRHDVVLVAANVEDAERKVFRRLGGEIVPLTKDILAGLVSPQVEIISANLEALLPRLYVPVELVRPKDVR